MSKKYFIGTSGWEYNHWNKKFYPDKIPKNQWLEFYANHFNSVEVNATFYSQISRKTFEKWYNSTPYNFKFTLKGSRYITHMKKLKNIEKPLEKFCNSAEPLKRKLGCILWQLPPMLKKNLDRLEKFCNSLDNRKNNIIEFRDKSWFDNDTYKILKKTKTGFCTVSAPKLPDKIIKTSGIIYIRFHGKRKWYTSSYSKKSIKKWAEKIKSRKAESVYCYFNNDFNANAVKNAKTMKGELNA